VRELWQILDNTQWYATHPDLLVPFKPGKKSSEVKENEDHQIVRDILSQWELARIETDLAGLRLFWIGDALRESLLPPGADQNLIYRYETLASCLDGRLQKSNQAQREEVFSECFRDVLALAGALIPHRGFILTQQGIKSDDDSDCEPLLCSYLREWGIQCHRIESEDAAQMQKEFIVPILARAGISELMWAGLRLVAVHLVLPEAAIIPPVRCEDDSFPAELSPLDSKAEVCQKDWWRDAVCFWYFV
jgi:hypothetical protein